MADFSIGDQVLPDQLLLKEEIMSDEKTEILSLKSKVIEETRKILQEFFHPNEEDIRGAIAPGRVNLIGDHVDYCDGFVLPMNIPLYTCVMGIKNPKEKKFRVYSSHNKELIEFDDLNYISKIQLPFWTSYIRGALFYSECPVGLDFVVHSTIPPGSGLSSSAALELAVFLFARQYVPGNPVSPVDMALACQKAEHNFALVPCGIMDQFVISLGLPGHALKIDCRSLEYDHIPITFGDDFVFLITNSGVRHSLANGEYKKRRENVDSAVQLLRVPSWRDVNHEMIRKNSSSFNSPEQLDNAYHVVAEIERTLKASNALLDNNIILFGKYMAESHASLRDKYKVSCKELDELVDLALNFEGVFGSRMTGGGFGGCTVTLVKRDRVEALKEHLALEYSGSSTTTFFVCEPVGGARVVEF